MQDLFFFFFFCNVLNPMLKTTAEIFHNAFIHFFLPFEIHESHPHILQLGNLAHSSAFWVTTARSKDVPTLSFTLICIVKMIDLKCKIFYLHVAFFHMPTF